MFNLGLEDAMVVMDFKMKFEAICSREKTTDFYATYNLINGTTNNVNEGNCESESDEEDCASSENEIFEKNSDEDIGVVEKGRGSLTKCIVYGVEGNIPEKHRIGLAVASNINDLDMESDDENPIQCNLCRREFATAYKMEIHNCKAALGQHDLISQAIVYAKDIYEQHQFEVINTSSNVEEHV
ncbi:Hypothetical predicted protein [Octopus vulgaris]|uniref:C2H2-type domain-containing protein n=1 Tax=Octopus vulgaris TaxID=6645 RepID=A0AA36EWB4_OCTVU|nr:Hypothetical predicted protein [Octopus vulgaris]